MLLGALAVQGGLGAGELLAQRGDGVVRGGQLRGSGGERGVVPLLVLLAGAGSVRARLPGCGHGGVTLGAGGGDGRLGFGDPCCGCLAFVVQGTIGVAGRCSACWRAAASASIAVRASAAAARASAASSSAACRATAWLAVSARACSSWAAVSARTASACASAASGSPAAASWLAEGGELVQRGGQLGAQPAHRGEGVVADGRGPADGRGDRPVLAGLAGELGAAPERGHRGVPDQHRRAVPAVFGDLLLAVAGPGTRGGRVFQPGRAGASGVPAPARRAVCLRPVSGPGLRSQSSSELSFLLAVPGHGGTK